MKRILKRIITMSLVFALLFGVAHIDSYAANKYKINGVTVSVTDYSSSPNECWVYANKLYKKIWGENFTNQFSHSSNSLRNLSDSQLKLTPDNLKKYVLNAELGAVLRVCNKEYLHGTDGWGHSQIIVQKDANGFTVLEGGLSASPYRREHYYTWENYCYSRWPGKYEYIKYIKWPGAPAFKEPNGTLSVSLTNNNSSVALKWTTYWDYTEKYKIERAASKDGPWATLKTVADMDELVYTDTSAEPGKNYYYRVRPYNEDGDAGKYTSVAQIVTGAKLETTSVSSANPSITLKWTKTDGYTAGYWVYRATSANGPWTLVYTCTDGNVLSWADKNIESGQIYYYYVQPYNSSKKGGPVSWIVKDRAMQLASEPFEGTVTRVYGNSRYKTSYQIAEELKEALDVEKFQTVVVATGNNFADALSGSYLAYVKNAPILLADGKSDVETLTTYLKDNLESKGMVYILGGSGAISEEYDTALSAYEYEVKRLKGDTRYETNIAILKEAGVEAEEIVVCTGANYADCISASASKKPIFLVSEALSDNQKIYLEELSCSKYYIAGGTAAVNGTIESELADFGQVERIYGENRYETSVRLSEELCSETNVAIIAYGGNFPDGLCGGPLAAQLDAPIILTNEDKCFTAKKIMTERAVTEGYILGGAGVVSDLIAKVVFDMCAEDTILEKKYE